MSSNGDSQKMLRAVAQQARIDYTEEAGTLLSEVVYEHEFPLPAVKAYLHLREAGFSDNEIRSMKKFMLKWKTQRAFQRNIRIQDIETEIGIHAQMTKPYNPNDNAEAWEMMNEAIWSKIFARGVVGVITGVMGSGKTETAVLMEEILLRSGLRVVSNIKMTKKVEGYHYTLLLSEIVRTLASDEKHNYILIIDESGISANKKDAMSQKNKRIEAITRTIRKLHSAVIFIDQTYSTFPTLVQEVEKLRIDKLSKTIAKIDNRTEKYPFKKTLKYIPKTKLPWDTDDIAHISMDLDVNAMLDYVAEKTANGGSQKKAMLDYIKNMNVEKEKKNRTITMAELQELAAHVIFRIENGETYLRTRDAIVKEYEKTLSYKDARALFQIVKDLSKK